MTTHQESTINANGAEENLPTASAPTIPRAAAADNDLTAALNALTVSIAELKSLAEKQDERLFTLEGMVSGQQRQNDDTNQQLAQLLLAVQQLHPPRPTQRTPSTTPAPTTPAIPPPVQTPLGGYPNQQQQQQQLVNNACSPVPPLAPNQSLQFRTGFEDLPEGVVFTAEQYAQFKAQAHQENQWIHQENQWISVRAMVGDHQRFRSEQIREQSVFAANAVRYVAGAMSTAEIDAANTMFADGQAARIGNGDQATTTGILTHPGAAPSPSRATLTAADDASMADGIFDGAGAAGGGQAASIGDGGQATTTSPWSLW